MPEAPLADATVLLVEDEALLRRQLTAHLERAGAQAQSGRRGGRCARSAARRRWIAVPRPGGEGPLR